MAIKLQIKPTESILFCCSKWWGNPDLPPQVEYPTMKIMDEESGEEMDYPLTFICQIDCSDIAPFDTEGKLPHEGMLYFFAAIDDLIGYESPEHFGQGHWPKKAVMVKYTKAINMETFESSILVDDENNELAEPEMAIEFSACDEKSEGIELLGIPTCDEVSEAEAEAVNLLQIDAEGCFNIMMKASDLKFGNWKRAFGYYHASNRD